MDWSVVAQKLAGESESGDLYLVKPFLNGILVAVIDGIGHGSEAANAARIVVDTLETYPQESIISLVERCHKSLKETRGAAMSLASFNTLSGTMTWLGVGNVEGVLLHADASARPVHKSLLLRAGIVGCHLPQLHVTVAPVTRGDTLILATDGIHYNFVEGITLNDSPQQIADRILARHCKGNDDAMVLVARYLGDTQ